MAYIVDFKVQGLAGRKEVYEQKLDRNVNVFFGPNGSGKTSLLKILHSAMLGDSSIISHVPFESAKVRIFSESYKKIFTRIISKSPSKQKTLEFGSEKIHEGIDRKPDKKKTKNRKPEKKSKKELIWIDVPKSSKASNINWIHKFLSTWRIYEDEDDRLFRIRQDRLLREQEYNFDLYFAERLNILWASYSNEVLSEIQNVQGEGLASILKSILSTEKTKKKKRTIDFKTAYDRVLAFLDRQGQGRLIGSIDDFEATYKKDHKIRKIVDDINLVEQKIETAKTSRNKLQLLISDMFSGNKVILFKDTGISIETDDGQEIGLSSLSSGEKQAIWLFVQTLLVKGNSLLIDEPEISLNIDWQKKLLSSMLQLEPRVQLIVATHSPEIMANIADEEIYKL